MGDNNRLQEMFAEFLKIYKFINHPQIIASLNSELSDKTKKTVYELSNGENTTRDIAKVAGISISTITSYWKLWALKGIVVPAQRQGRFKAAFDLAEYGLSVISIDEQGGEE